MTEECQGVTSFLRNKANFLVTEGVKEMTLSHVIHNQKPYKKRPSNCSILEILTSHP